MGVLTREKMLIIGVVGCCVISHLALADGDTVTLTVGGAFGCSY